MATDPGLVVALEARLNRFEQQLKEAGHIADREVSNIEKRFAKMNPQMGFVGNFVKGTLAAFSLEKAIRGVLNAVSDVADIGDVAERTGLSAEAFQELRFALASVGADATVAATGIQTFASNIQRAAEGGGYLAKVFKANGVAISKDMNENLAIMADLIANVSTEQGKLQLAQEAFGKGAGREFVDAMKNGSAGLDEFGRKGREVGAIIKNDVVKNAQDLDAQWKVLMQTLTAKAQGNIIEMIPKVQEWLNKLDEWASRVLPILQLINSWTFDWARDAMGIPKFPDSPGNGVLAGPRGPAAKVNVFGGRSGGTVLPPRGGGGPDSFAREVSSIEKRIEVMNAETKAIDQGTVAMERAKVVAELEAAAKEANSKAGLKNTEVTAAQRVEIDRVAASYEAAAKAAENAKNPLATFGREAANVTKNLQEAGVSALKGFEDALIGVANGTVTAAEAFRKMANAIIEDLARIAIRASITGPIASMLGGGGGLGGGLFSLFARASGGPVAAGQPYMVGEKGAELFVPKTSGNIVPNDVMRRGGMGGPTIVVSPTYHFDAGIGPADQALIRAQILQSEQRTRSDVVSIVRAALIRDSDALAH